MFSGQHFIQGRRDINKLCWMCPVSDWTMNDFLIDSSILCDRLKETAFARSGRMRVRYRSPQEACTYSATPLLSSLHNLGDADGADDAVCKNPRSYGSYIEINCQDGVRC